MRTILILLTAGSLLHAQEPPKVTLDAKGKFSEVVRTLEKAVSCPIPAQAGVEDKEVSISLRNAGFFEAIDALCRAHGNVTYFSPDKNRRADASPPFQLLPGAHPDQPGAYSGPFKVIVPAMNRFRSRSVDGEQAWTCVHLVLLAPPSIRVDHLSGAEVEWKLLDVRDAGGAGMLPKDAGLRQQVSLAESQYLEDNVAFDSERLSDFDLDRGLSLLKGEIKLTTADSKEVRIALQPGKEADVPGGKILFEGMQEYEADSWRIALTFKPSGTERPLPKLLENRVQCESQTWEYLNLPYTGQSFEVDAFRPRRKPTWIKLRVRSEERTQTVPFELRDVRFKKD